FSLDMLPAPPASTPSPYTPLFRSGPCALAPARRHVLARSTARHSRNGAPGNRSNALRARPEPRPDGRAQAPPSRRLRGTDPRAPWLRPLHAQLRATHGSPGTHRSDERSGMIARPRLATPNGDRDGSEQAREDRESTTRPQAALRGGDAEHAEPRGRLTP